MRVADVITAYDIRGRVPGPLTPEVARALGSAFAQVVVLPEGHREMVLGKDMRESSSELAGAVLEGARSQGVDVTDLGLCSTDALYYASGSRGLPGAMVTASHNPAGYNGIKLCRAGARPVGQESGLGEIRDLAQWLLDRGALHALAAGPPGAVRHADVLPDYAGHLHSLVDLDGIRPLRLVVDAGNAMAGLTVPAVLGIEGLPLAVEPLYFELDGTFPHHDANPLDPANLRDLQDAVVRSGADLGLAFDGDADRVVLVDERGTPVPAGAVAALIATREIARDVSGGRSPGDITVVHGSVVSRAVEEAVAGLGARLVRSPVGHSFVKQRMAAHGAVFGAEHSAHYYFRDFWYADSGLLAALHVLGALGRHEGTLSSLLSPLDRYAASGEINSAVHDVAAATGRVRDWALAHGARELEGDGLLVSSDDDPFWWVSLRASNTESLLRLNVEAQDGETMVRVRDAVLALVRQEA
ncbi:phosphomannomutase/phosphoglucomutase [Serinicoccus chungangensis]|uniref:phosphomannomutase/phosphoglucomutase n=1 Tax=Serinicoccus chungangensis TaxID=767452 RepID=UPI001118E0C3|nr:phosphomannomutase/phosphoglucomutase [Serinicoccus chungangensis]